jgi:hypothetical protein
VGVAAGNVGAALGDIIGGGGCGVAETGGASC